MDKKYDVVVIGGGTSGCAAAYTAGKLGLKTLIVEQGGCLGGAMTSGLVVPVMFTGDKLINNDFYKTLISEMEKINAQFTYNENSGWFNPELLKIILDKMMSEANVDIIFNANINNIVTDNKMIKSIELAKILSPYYDKIYTNNTIKYHNRLSVYIGAKYFIDATGDGNFSKKINCEILDDNSEFQPMSLRFIMSGVDSEKFANWIYQFDEDRNVTTVQNTDKYTYFSTAYTWDTDKHWALAPIFKRAISDNVLNERDCNYFQMFSVAGTPDAVAFNCPRVVENLNPCDVFDRTKALLAARASILRLSNFCIKYLPGFENAYVVNISDNLGVRVSNRIKGKYVYTIEDLKIGKTFEHPVLISTYPVDVHSKDKNASNLIQTGEYQLPIESLMSADYDNLYIVGRCLSADYLAQGALRVQANCFSMGEGVAKHIFNNA